MTRDENVASQSAADRLPACKTRVQTCVKLLTQTNQQESECTAVGRQPSSNRSRGGERDGGGVERSVGINTCKALQPSSSGGRGRCKDDGKSVREEDTQEVCHCSILSLKVFFKKPSGLCP